MDDFFRRWAEPAIVVLIIGAYVLMILLFGAINKIQANQEDIITNQDEGKERGFQTRAVACESVIIDNDRTFPLSLNCTDGDVIKYYPPAVCVYFGNPPICGTKYQQSPYPDPPRTGGD